MLSFRLKQKIKMLWPYFMASPFIGLTTGANLALATLASEKYNWGAAHFSALFVVASLAGLLMSVSFPRLLKKKTCLTHIPFLSVVAILSYFPLAFYPQEYLFWLLTFFIRAFVASALYFLIEASFMEKLKPSEQARGITFYYISAIAGFMLSPLLYASWGLTTISILVAPLSFILAAVFLHKYVQVEKQLKQSPKVQDFVQLFKATPAVWLVCFLSGIAAESVDSFLGVVGIKFGYTAVESLTFMSFFFFGGLVLQYPLSHFMDRSKKMPFVKALVLFSLFWCFIIILASYKGYWAFGLSLSLWGGLCYTLGTAGLALVGDKFIGSQRLLGVALHAALYQLGCLAGPVVLGVGLHYLKGQGVVLAFGLCCLVVGLLMQFLPDKKVK